MRFIAVVSLLGVLLLTACAGNSAKPDWAKREPVDSQFFTTVVRTGKYDAEYASRARDTALKNISLQINVQVDAQLSRLETEAYGLSATDFRSLVQTSSRSLLQDVQPAAVYETKKDYWAYYRVNKQQYYLQRQRNRDRAVAIAADLMRRYDAAGADLAAAIPYLLDAMQEIADYTDMDLVFDSGNSRLNLYTEIISRIRALPQQLNPSVSPESIAMTARENKAVRIDARILFSRDAQRQVPCTHFPLAVSFAKGSGRVSPQVFTDNSGSAGVLIEKVIAFDPVQTLAVTVDKEHFLKLVESPLVKKLWNGLSFRTALVNIQVSRPAATIEYSFNGIASTSYLNVLKDRLRQLDMDVVDSSARAGYRIVLRIESKPGAYIPSLKVFSALGDTYITLLDASGNILASESVLNIKATGQTASQAESNTELACIRAVSDDLIFRFVMNHILSR